MGAAALRDSIVVSREQGDDRQENSGWLNLADALNLSGRLGEARAVLKEGLARDLRPYWPWLPILRAELAIEAGEWNEAEAALQTVGTSQTGNTLVNLDLRRAELALGRGDHALARERLAEAAELGDCIDQPQFGGVLGALAAELERREGDLAAARRWVRETLSRLRARPDDAARLARVSAAGTTVAADAAQRAHDLGDSDDEHAALLDADEYVARGECAAQNGGPVEHAWLLTSRAERTRAGGAPDPGAYAAAVEAWNGLERPYPAAVMRFREAEAYLTVGERDQSVVAARDAHASATGIGAGWLSTEVEGLAACAHLELAPSDLLPLPRAIPP